MFILIVDHYYPNWACLVLFFVMQGWKIVGMAGYWTPQPYILFLSRGACDLLTSLNYAKY